MRLRFFPAATVQAAKRNQHDTHVVGAIRKQRQRRTAIAATEEVFGSLKSPTRTRLISASRKSVMPLIASKQCEAEAEQAEWLRTVDASLIHHTRVRFGNLCLYRLDPTSPSNFMLLRSVAATAANEAILASKRVCQLSPTELA